MNVKTIFLSHRIADQNIPQSSLIRACITPIELNTQDFGFSIMYDHLDVVRSCCKNISQFKRNAKLVLNDQSRFDPLLEEAFRYFVNHFSSSKNYFMNFLSSNFFHTFLSFR